MYTRCKGCHTVHPVNASLLAKADGSYRCGKCKKKGNALEELFDEWPAAGEKAPTAGNLPELGLTLDLDGAKAARLGDIDTSSTRRSRRIVLMRAAWISMALVVAIAVVFKLGDFIGKPLSEQSLIQSVTSGLGIGNPVSAEPFRDVSQIHLVSRELRSHPDNAEMLQLKATIVNRANQPQPYPELQVILLDASGETVNQVLFTPSDYLSEKADDHSGMTPQAYLPLELNLSDPGKEAVGFELNFL
jgi:predicted Zn finger-like uncharacterized protein